MFDRLLPHLSPVELADKDLNEPVSLCADGHVSTVGDLIEQKAPSFVKHSFGMSDYTTVSEDKRIVPVNNLDYENLRKLSVELVKRADPGESVAFIGGGSYSKNDLIREIEHDTFVGKRIVSDFRTHSLFLEKAIENGKVIRAEDNATIDIPSFDF